MTTLLESALVSEDWALSDEKGDKPVSLLVQLRRQAYVLPWFRFVYSAGTNDKVEIVFASHIVTVSGYGLAALLLALSSQRVIRLVQPTESEAKFKVRGPNSGAYNGPGITDITVEPVQ